MERGWCVYVCVCVCVCAWWAGGPAIIVTLGHPVMEIVRGRTWVYNSPTLAKNISSFLFALVPSPHPIHVDDDI